ncbi:MAG: acetamidase/formamidase family protein [Armatimonadetes bacterium]|nr:acetamidase/formamidase family protein [Armatimonadota bacterium]
MQRIGTDVLYFETGPFNEPTHRVRPGEEFEVQTQINAGPWLDEHPDGEALRKRLRGGNPASGCIAVEGAEPGQMLRVHIGEIRLDPLGFTRFRGANGAFPGWLGPSGVPACHKIVQIRDGCIHWGDRRLPAAPMLGFVGVAPPHEQFANRWGGCWGGNMDVQEVTAGATICLPVYVPGALLHVGDMHAIQGDGEICGAGGIEASGTVRLRCELAPKPEEMCGPRILNETHIITVACARPAEDAFRQALAAMILWLEAEHGFDRQEAYLLLGQVLEARCTQFVNPTFTYVAKVARRWLRSG